MFEDSLVESTGRIRTRSRWFAIGSFAIQALLLSALIVIPYLFPASLPREALTTPLLAPPPPADAPSLPHVAVSRAASAVQTIALRVPRIIPNHVDMEDNGSPAPTGLFDPRVPSTGDVIGAMPPLGPAPAPPEVTRPKPIRPVRVSAGVAEGQLLAPIQPSYPVIAREAHVEGTVVVEALISKQGLVEQARVVSGPSLLTGAALSAVDRARYRPYRLNGEPVQVETTIQIIFRLGE